MSVESLRAGVDFDEAFVQEICDLLFDISQGSCSLDDGSIEVEPDVGKRAVYTGLLMLHDELRFQNEQREAAEEQLRKREARTRALIDLAKVGIWDCSVAGVRAAIGGRSTESDSPFGARADEVRDVTKQLTIYAVNREGLRMLGAESTGEISSRLEAIVAEEGWRVFDELWAGLAAGRSRVEAEGTLHTLDGGRLRVLAGLSVPDGDGDERDVATITVADITAHHARVAAEQEARQRTTELARVNTEVESLFYAVAHDLRSPLRAVETLADWIVEDLEEGAIDEVRDHVLTLRGRIGRLDRMLNDLLSYARIGRTEHAVEPVDVGALLDELRDGLLPIPDAFALTWAPMPELETHRTLLSQVFLNLIGNAIKHHDKAEGHIRVECDDAGDWLVFRVTDDGPGIEPAYRGKVFGLFSTLKRRDEVEGSGMGLAFVQKVVRRLGGEIRVEGPEGRGITFAFDWPKSASASRLGPMGPGPARGPGRPAS